MNETKHLEEVRKKLLDRKNELEQELAELYEEKAATDQVKDMGDQAVSSSLESLRSSLQDRELSEYNMIIQVLDKIDRGEYGTCSDCQEPISARRLEVYPNVTRCIACQEALEE